MRKLIVPAAIASLVLLSAAAPAVESAIGTLFDRSQVTAEEALARELAGRKGPIGHDHADHDHGPVEDPARAGTADEVAVDASEGVTLVEHFPYDGIDDLFAGGTDLAFDGKYVYAAQFGDAGGVHIFNAEGHNPQKVGFFDCPGTQNDVATLGDGLIVLGFHEGGEPGSDCEEEGGGVRIIDVSDPANPVERGNVLDIPGGTHTIKVHPEEPIIYASPGGMATNGGGPTSDGGVQQIIDASDPDAPYVRSQFQPHPNGCHDVYVSVTDQRDQDLIACVGLGESQLWDITDDPFSPRILSRIHNPAIFFDHSAAMSDDGDLLVIGDENFGAHECDGGPTGAMFAYDISTPQLPVLVPQGYFGIDRHQGDDPHVSSSTLERETWCTAHQFDFIPGTRTMVASWYTAGMNVIDWSDPTAPRELEHYRLEGPAFENTNYWSAYWHDGYVFANDRGRGLDVLHVEGLPEADSPKRAPRPRGR